MAILRAEGTQAQFPQKNVIFQDVIPSNARDLGFCCALAQCGLQARTQVPRVRLGMTNLGES